MSSVDGLKKLYLVKSAGFEFEEIDLSSNTLLLGDSGVGKTTIMRAVLFFYTMDYSDNILNINPDTKKSFNDWYFKEHNSHLIYEYTKGENRFLFIVSKSGKLHYTFVDLTTSSLSVEDLLLNATTPRNLEQLNEKIQTESLSNYSTTKREQYINTFHVRDTQNRKIKQDATTNFSLFETVSSRVEFAKTLSNIFASSKVSSNSLKKSIVSLINDSQVRINLNEIKISLSKYMSEKNEIESFESKIPVIEKLAITHNSYKASKKEFVSFANTLESLKENIAVEMQKNTLNTTELKKKQENTLLTYKLDSSLIQKQVTLKDNQISIDTNKIKEIQEKEAFYQTQDIEKLVANYNREKNFKSTLESSLQRYDVLTSGTKNIQEKYKKIQENLEKEMYKTTQELETLSQRSKEKINDNINRTIQAKEQKISDSSQIHIGEKSSLELELQSDTKKYNEIKTLLAQIKYFPFHKEKIESYMDEIKEFEKELSKTESSTIKNIYEIKKVEEELKKIEDALKDEMRKLDEKTTNAKELLFTQKTEIEKKLDFDSENLYGFLNKNNIRDKEKIVTFLKDDILFSEKKFKVKQHADNSTIFGLELEFEEEFANEYQQVKLLEQLRHLKEKIKELNKKTLKEKKNLEEIAQKETKEKNRQRASFYVERESLKDKKTIYTKSITLANENLKIAKKEAEAQREKEKKELQSKSALLDVSLENLNSKISNITQKIESIKEDISNAITETIFSFKEEIRELNLTKESEIENIKIKYSEASQITQNELAIALREEGVDESLLKEISTEINSLKAFLKNIDDKRILVTVYLDQFSQLIKEIPQMLRLLKEDEALRDELKEQLLKIEGKFKQTNQELKTEQLKLEKVKSSLEKFSSSYSKNIQDKDIAKSIKNSLSSQTPALEISLESDLSSIIDKVIQLYSKIKNDEIKIESLVNNCRLVLKPNNTFKIEIENDYLSSISYLKTAKELIAYIQDDKLSLLKEYSSEVFKSSLTSIQKYLGLFEDALLDIESEVTDLRNTINRAVGSFNVIDSIKIRYENSNHNILNSLKSLSEFYDNNNEKFLSGLFSSELSDTQTQKTKEELSSKISDLMELLKSSKEYIVLEDGFVLEFKVVENGNDLKWRQTLSDIGSNGTSTLVKSIINISMLQMVSKNITKESSLQSHCILDEIGTISTDYFRELKDFVNRSGFVFLNGMPIEDDMLISMYPTIYVGQKYRDYSRMILVSTMEI